MHRLQTSQHTISTCCNGFHINDPPPPRNNHSSTLHVPFAYCNPIGSYIHQKHPLPHPLKTAHSPSPYNPASTSAQIPTYTYIYILSIDTQFIDPTPHRPHPHSLLLLLRKTKNAAVPANFHKTRHNRPRRRMGHPPTTNPIFSLRHTQICIGRLSSPCLRRHMYPSCHAMHINSRRRPCIRCRHGQRIERKR